MLKFNTKQSFRVRAKQLFLTYPNCNLRAKEVAEQLFQIIDNNSKSNIQIKELVVCKETNEDNSPEDNNSHVHVYISLSSSVDTYGNKLTLKENNKEYKGNYQRVASKKNVIEYILKTVTQEEIKQIEQYSDKVYINEEVYSQLEFNNSLSKISLKNTSLDHTLIELAEAGKIQEAIELYKNTKPGQYVRYGKSIENGLNYVWLKTVGATTRFKLNDYNLDPRLWKLLYKLKESKQTLFIVGSTNTGKTQLISTFLREALMLNPKEIAWVGNLTDGLRVVTPQTKMIVMDDCDFSTTTREELLSLLDPTRNTTINIKGSSAVLRENVGRIALSNKHPNEYSVHFKDPAVIKRLCIINIGSNPLFNLNKVNIYEPPLPNEIDLSISSHSVSFEKFLQGTQPDQIQVVNLDPRNLATLEETHLNLEETHSNLEETTSNLEETTSKTLVNKITKRSKRLKKATQSKKSTKLENTQKSTQPKKLLKSTQPKKLLKSTQTKF